MMLALNREAAVDRTVLVQGYGAYGYDNSLRGGLPRQYPDSSRSVCILDQRQGNADREQVDLIGCRERWRERLRLLRS